MFLRMVLDTYPKRQSSPNSSMVDSSLKEKATRKGGLFYYASFLGPVPSSSVT